MKKYIIGIAAALLAACATSCIKDLDQLPLNKTDVTSETAYNNELGGYLQGLSKIYFELVSNDLTDLNIGDGGASELLRAYWSLNECSTDEAKCAWSGDAWVRAVNTNTYSEAANDAVLAVYARSIHGVTFTNEFLRQTTDDKLTQRGCSAEVKEKVAGLRAEARFLRAFYYYVAMDVFGRPCFVTEDSPFGAVTPAQIESRAKMFEYIESELLDLVKDDSDMPEVHANYPRADKGSCYGLLARMYLNAGVYTGTSYNDRGTERWEDAKKICEKIFTLGYATAPTYAELFRGDNGENPDAIKEMLFVASYNAEQTQSYGGTSYLSFSALSENDAIFHPTGINNGWGGNRIPYEFIQKYFAPTGFELYSNGRFKNANYTVTDARGEMFNVYFPGSEAKTKDFHPVVVSNQTAGAAIEGDVYEGVTKDTKDAVKCVLDSDNTQFVYISKDKAKGNADAGKVYYAIAKDEKGKDKADVKFTLVKKEKDLKAGKDIVNEIFKVVPGPSADANIFMNDDEEIIYLSKDAAEGAVESGVDYYSISRSKAPLGQVSEMTELYNFEYGWKCWKFNNIPHDQTAEGFEETAKTKAYSDIDFPIIRLGEIYLIHAEACMNLGEPTNATALANLKKLSDRAGVAAPTEITQEYLISERAKELMWEGHRRTDLIRWKLYTSSTFLWPWKGGTLAGEGFEDYKYMYALPPGEMTANPTLEQTPGYK